MASAFALKAAEVPKPPARTEVIFSNPDQFTDAKESYMDTEKGRDALLEQIREFIVAKADAVLPPGQRVSITFTDVDLAGDFEPWRGAQFGDIRIVKSIYPPGFKFTFKVTDESGRTVKEGSENIRDMAFDMRLTIDRQDPLRFEKDILNDWIRRHLRAPKA